MPRFYRLYTLTAHLGQSPQPDTPPRTYRTKCTLLGQLHIYHQTWLQSHTPDMRPCMYDSQCI